MQPGLTPVPMPAMDCYIVNLSHTQRSHRYLTIWRPDNRGYCWPLNWAGRYPLETVKEHLGYYNDGLNNVAVPCEVLERIAVAPTPGHIDNDAGPVVANTRANWRLILANVVHAPVCAPEPQFKGARLRARERA